MTNQALNAKGRELANAINVIYKNAVGKLTDFAVNRPVIHTNSRTHKDYCIQQRQR